MGITFCNPPYSQFEDWAVKIIRESASPQIYLVIPQRWQESFKIKDAIAYRKATLKVIGEFTFEDSEDRAARAKVHLLSIRIDRDEDDAFAKFFDLQFAELKDKFSATEKGIDDEEETKREEKPRFAGIVKAEGYADALVEMYNKELDHIQANYALVSKLDADLLRELHVFPLTVMKCLKTRLSDLKNTYWKELISRTQTVTNRMISTKRQAMLNKLNENGHVDFTMDNIHAVLIWILRNANESIDAQLIEVFEKMIEKANITNYKSNQRVLQDHEWRYNSPKPSHVALEYRLVLNHCGGIKKTSYSFDKGLDEQGRQFIQDLLTVAYNLGFLCDTTDAQLHRAGDWRTGEKHEFYYQKDGGGHLLFEVRAFYNWNIHIRLSQKFALALNVEMGRLKGWITTPAEAVEELGDLEAAQYFNSQVRLGSGNVRMLMAVNE